MNAFLNYSRLSSELAKRRQRLHENASLSFFSPLLPPTRGRKYLEERKTEFTPRSSKCTSSRRARLNSRACSHILPVSCSTFPARESVEFARCRSGDPKEQSERSRVRARREVGTSSSTKENAAPSPFRERGSGERGTIVTFSERSGECGACERIGRGPSNAKISFEFPEGRIERVNQSFEFRSHYVNWIEIESNPRIEIIARKRNNREGKTYLCSRTVKIAREDRSDSTEVD